MHLDQSFLFPFFEKFLTCIDLLRKRAVYLTDIASASHLFLISLLVITIVANLFLIFRIFTKKGGKAEPVEPSSCRYCEVFASLGNVVCPNCGRTLQKPDGVTTEPEP
jgi:hypothetical protein